VQLTSLYLQIETQDFTGLVKNDSNVVDFLVNFYNELFEAGTADNLLGQSKNGTTLRRHCFQLVHRILIGSSLSPRLLLTWEFIGSFCHAHRKEKGFDQFIHLIWTKQEKDITASLNQIKSNLNRFRTSDPTQYEKSLQKLAPIFYTLPEAAAQFATGSEFLDELVDAYKNASPRFRSNIVPVAYLLLTSLSKPPCQNQSVLLDHIYSMKPDGESHKDEPSLLSDLVTNTPLLKVLTASGSTQSSQRAKTLAVTLVAFKNPSITRNRLKKSTSRAKNDSKSDHDANGEHHIHLLSKISQIQDLFPDFGTAYISKLLDHFTENVEQVISHLLEGDLPAHLQNLDPSADLENGNAISNKPQVINDLPARRNIYDNDDFDRLAVGNEQILTADSERNIDTKIPMSDPSRAKEKASILAALAAFDSDDDERDDTYDDTDVGGTVDTAARDGEVQRDNPDKDNSLESQEGLLFSFWKKDPKAFDRGRESRTSITRTELKKLTGLTDEVIEGWGVMLARDGAGSQESGRGTMLHRLERKYGESGWNGGQTALEKTSYRQEKGESDNNDSTDEGDRRTMTQSHGRFRGGFQHGRGKPFTPNVAGDPSNPQTQASRQRKEANKGSKANHNRRDQRAKKMARGGFTA